MRLLSVGLTTLLLVSPLSAAAYSTPSTLVTAMQSGSPRSFSVTAHAEIPGATFVSVWANGSLQGAMQSNVQVSTKATIDIVSGDFKIRAKAEFMVVDSVLYAKLNSLDGSLQNPIASMALNVKQHTWLKTSLDAGSFGMAQNPVFALSETAMMDADSIFDMTSSKEKFGTNYALTLKPDAAAQLALMIRELLQDTESTSTDFFPWRDLAEGMHFAMNVKTDAKDMFISSTYAMDTKGKQSSFSLVGSEKAATAFKLKAPVDAISMDELGSMLMNEIPGSLDLPSEVEMMNDASSSDDFDSLDEGSNSMSDASCEDPSIEPLQLLMMQRDGTCPVTKASNR